MFVPTFGGGTLSIIPLWIFRTRTKVPTLPPELKTRMKSPTQLHPPKRATRYALLVLFILVCPSQLGSWIIHRSQNPSKQLQYLIAIVSEGKGFTVVVITHPCNPFPLCYKQWRGCWLKDSLSAIILCFAVLLINTARFLVEFKCIIYVYIFDILVLICPYNHTQLFNKS